MKQTLNNFEDMLMVHYYLSIRKKRKKIRNPRKTEKNPKNRKSMLLMCNKTN